MARWQTIPTPRWAADLNEQVCSDEKRDTAKLIWSRRVGEHRTYGQTSQAGVIDVGVGTDGYEHGVLLHELAHYLSPARVHHGPEFWSKAFDLYERYGDKNIEQFVVDEFSYRKGAYYEASRRPRWRQAAATWNATRQKAARTVVSHARFEVGEEVVLGKGMPWGYAGKRAIIVDVRRTRALVKMVDDTPRFKVGDRCLAPMSQLVKASEVKQAMSASRVRAEIGQLAGLAEKSGGKIDVDAKTLREWLDGLMAEAGR